MRWHKELALHGQSLLECRECHVVWAQRGPRDDINPLGTHRNDQLLALPAGMKVVPPRMIRGPRRGDKGRGRKR